MSAENTLNRIEVFLDSFEYENDELTVSQIRRFIDNSGCEWECPECHAAGMYFEIRSPIDHGVDCCPNCSIEVVCIE